MSNFITPTFRVSFPKVFEPSDDFNTGKLTYSLQMLVPKDGEEINIFKKQILDIMIEKYGDKEKALNKIKSPMFSNPINDGDNKEFPSHKGHWYINTKSKFSPGLINADRSQIINPDDFYAGVYARASLSAFVWERQGKFGVSFSLQHIQKVKDGEPFVTSVKAEDVFDAIGTATTNKQDDVINF